MIPGGNKVESDGSYGREYPDLSRILPDTYSSLKAVRVAHPERDRKTAARTVNLINGECLYEIHSRLGIETSHFNF
jgi:hypothetical protein